MKSFHYYQFITVSMYLAYCANWEHYLQLKDISKISKINFFYKMF